MAVYGAVTISHGGHTFFLIYSRCRLCLCAASCIQVLTYADLVQILLRILLSDGYLLAYSHLFSGIMLLQELDIRNYTDLIQKILLRN